MKNFDSEISRKETLRTYEVLTGDNIEMELEKQFVEM
jgi:hypothetical protein